MSHGDRSPGVPPGKLGPFRSRAIASRTTRDVLEDHLKCRAAGDPAGDLKQNHTGDVVLLCKYGVCPGREAVRDPLQRRAYRSLTRRSRTSSARRRRTLPSRSCGPNRTGSASMTAPIPSSSAMPAFMCRPSTTPRWQWAHAFTKFPVSLVSDGSREK